MNRRITIFTEGRIDGTKKHWTNYKLFMVEVEFMQLDLKDIKMKYLRWISVRIYELYSVGIALFFMRFFIYLLRLHCGFYCCFSFGLIFFSFFYSSFDNNNYYYHFRFFKYPMIVFILEQTTKTVVIRESLTFI